MGRPYVDTLSGSSFPNMKELRITLPNGEWRIAFAFDPKRKAVLLVGGSKSGINERKFYQSLIRIADTRFTQHLEEIKGEKMMSISHDEVMESLTPERRARIKTKAKEIFEEEMTLRDLRTVQHLTQARLAELLGVEQDSVSRMERRTDMLLSTMTSFVEAMGGKLSLIAEFPNRRPYTVKLSDLASKAQKSNTFKNPL